MHILCYSLIDFHALPLIFIRPRYRLKNEWTSSHPSVSFNDSDTRNLMQIPVMFVTSVNTVPVCTFFPQKKKKYIPQHFHFIPLVLNNFSYPFTNFPFLGFPPESFEMEECTGWLWNSCARLFWVLLRTLLFTYFIISSMAGSFFSKRQVRMVLFVCFLRWYCSLCCESLFTTLNLRDFKLKILSILYYGFNDCTFLGSCVSYPSSLSF